MVIDYLVSIHHPKTSLLTFVHQRHSGGGGGVWVGTTSGPSESTKGQPSFLRLRDCGVSHHGSRSSGLYRPQRLWCEYSRCSMTARGSNQERRNRARCSNRSRSAIRKTAYARSSLQTTRGNWLGHGSFWSLTGRTVTLDSQRGPSMGKGWLAVVPNPR